MNFMKKNLMVLLLLFALSIIASYAEEDDYSDIPSDVNTYDSWRFDYIEMNPVWSQLDLIPYKEGESEEIIVAVIDTGINLNHPDLNIMDNGYDFYHRDDDPTDYNGHGTHVAGIIGAKINSGSDNVVGIAPGVKILPIKVYSDTGYINSFAVSKGIIYAVDNDADVINMSLYISSGLKHVDEAIAYAEAKGVIIVASSGNTSNHWIDGEDYHQKYSGSDRFSNIILTPASYSTTISVGSVAKHPSKDELGISDFSNIAGNVDGVFSEIDVVAPGSYILSSNYRSNTTGKIMSGTSMAAPHVTGLIVLLKAKYPFLSPANIRDIVRETAYNQGIALPSDYDEQDRLNAIGQGLIDINAALNYSPLKSLTLFDNYDFGYNSLKYNYLLSVDSTVDTLKLNGEMASGSRIIYKENVYEKISDIDIALDKDITVFEFQVEKYGITRRYKFFVKYKQDPNDSRIAKVNLGTTGLNEKTSESNMDYYISFDQDITNIKFNILTKISSDMISFIDSNGESGFIYPSNHEFNIPLSGNTTVVAVRIRGEDNNESSHMIAFIKNEKLESVYTRPNNDLDPIIITSSVSINLNTDAIVLDYGVDADPNFTSYDFQATVRGASKNDVIWSVDDNQYVTVDANGVVTTKEDVPDGVGDFSVKLKAQSVVGGAVDYADILFVEKTPLGKVEFFAPYISGYSDGTFRPKKEITRAEVATIFSKILNLEVEETGNQVFTDVDNDHWAYAYIQAMYETNIFSGYKDGSFLPSAPITRAEVAQVITNYWKYSDMSVNSSHIVAIPDVKDEFWAADAIHRLYNTRVTTGYLNNAYRPNDDTTREELVYMVNKLLGREPLESEKSKFIDVAIDYFYYGDIEAASEFYVKKRILTE